MTDTPDSKPTPASRIVEATLFRSGILVGTIQIIGSTKHGPTNMLAVQDPDFVEDGDVIKTQVWLLKAKEFVVDRLHEKPMKIPGVWYEVRPVIASKGKSK